MTPKPDLRPYRNGPDSQSHSAMQMWARENVQPDLSIIITFDDGSVWVEKFKPSTKEISYKAGDEIYTQTVDIPGKWEFERGEKGLTKNQCVAAQKAFCKDQIIISIEAILE